MIAVIKAAANRIQYSFLKFKLIYRDLVAKKLQLQPQKIC